MNLFVVEMLRFNDREKHSYVLGVYADYEIATIAGEVEKVWRGGKYTPAISRVELNAGPSDEEMAYYQRCTQMVSVPRNVGSSDTN